MPFFNTCSNTTLKKENKKILESIKNSDNLTREFRKELVNDEEKRFKDRTKENDSHVLNAYQLAKMPLQDPDIKMFKEPFFYFTICFSTQILSVILMFILFWKNKIKTVQLMTLANIAILTLSLLFPIFDGMLKYIDQIKIGYYLYLLNLIIIYFFIKRERKKNERAITHV